MLVDIKEAARQLNCKPQSLYNQYFRAQIGLAGVRIGRNLRFDENDISRVIRAQKESLPVMPAKEGRDV